MKKLILTIIAGCLCSLAFAQAPRNNADVRDYEQSGPGKRTARYDQQSAELGYNPYIRKNALAGSADIQYGTEIESVGLGFKFSWMMTNDWRLAPNMTFWLKNNDLSSFDINVDVHYLAHLNNRWRMYPIAGLTLAYWKQDANATKNKDSGTKFGINLGAGIEFDIDRHFFINSELKYRLISKYDQGIIALGVGYRF